MSNRMRCGATGTGTGRRTFGPANAVRVAAAAAAVAMTLAAGCAPKPPAFNPRELTATELGSAQTVVPQRRQPLPTELRGPFVEGTEDQPTPPPATGPVLGIEPVVRLSLQEAVQRAVINNPDVEVQAYAPAIEETRAIQEEAAFDPVWFTRAQYESRDEQTIGSGLFGPSLQDVDTETIGLRTGVRQDLTSGGNVELRYQADRTDVNGATFEPNPAWDNELVLQITQPLLRNFGSDVNRARITISRNNQHISVLDFRQRLEEVLFQLEQTYWQLVQARLEVEIAERLLTATIDTADLLFKRREQDVTRVEISQANAAVQTRQAVLIRARARVRDLSDTLKRLMNDPDLPVSGPTLVLPATEAIEAPIVFALEEQIAAALTHRAELGQQALRIENARVAQLVGRDALLPSLNVVGSVGVPGLDEDFGGAADAQAEFESLNWAVGLELEVPIGNRAARAAYTRTRLQRLQAIAQYKVLVEQITLEIKQALREVDTAWEAMVASRDEVFAAADALDALEQREQANEPLTPDFVDRKLRLQQAVAEAEARSAAALTDYNVAIVNLERAKGTLLRYNNVLMEEAAPRAVLRDER